VLLCQRADGDAVGRDQGSPHNGTVLDCNCGTQVIAPGEQRLARGRADTRGGMAVHYAHALRGELVDVRGSCRTPGCSTAHHCNRDHRRRGRGDWVSVWRRRRAARLAGLSGAR
jgi:hypothetical protein